MAWGLVNQVVDSLQLMSCAEKLARQVVQTAPLAIAALMQVLRETEMQSLEQAYQTQRSGKLSTYQAMLASDDAREGPLAFAQRRAPQWTGR